MMPRGVIVLLPSVERSVEETVPYVGSTEKVRRVTSSRDEAEALGAMVTW